MKESNHTIDELKQEYEQISWLVTVILLVPAADALNFKS